MTSSVSPREGTSQKNGSSATNPAAEPGQVGRLYRCSWINDVADRRPVPAYYHAPGGPVGPRGELENQTPRPRRRPAKTNALLTSSKI